MNKTSIDTCNSSGGGLNGVRHDSFDKIISLENLFLTWRQFKKGKSARPDIQKFELHLEDNIFAIHEQLETKSYRPSKYRAFYVRDPKLRHIHKASVADRLVHHALFRILYPIFDKSFIHNSYSCRIGKGTHRGVARLERFLKRLSHNGRKPILAMKCDIKKFFDSVDHEVLKNLTARKISDPDTLWLTSQIIDSFEKSMDKGLPLGNVTSQLFANIYLNELDQFIKRRLKIKYYLRYCDDFVIVGKDVTDLITWYRRIEYFLNCKLDLAIHKGKTAIRKYFQGIDFLGYVLLPGHRVLRTKTKRRIFRKFKYKNLSESSKQSYLGVLKHCNGYNLRKRLLISKDLK